MSVDILDTASVERSVINNDAVPSRKRKHENDDEETKEKRFKIAMQRWGILKQALLGGKSTDTCRNVASVRRFSSYGLLQTQLLSTTKDDETWHLYRCRDFPKFNMKIKHLAGKMNANTLNGFNNTGNVCVWPSEEVMTYHCLNHLDDYRKKSVIELGGGMTCLAGVSLALMSEASEVILTDGNEDSIKNLQEILDEKDNKKQFKDTKVSCRMLRWGAGTISSELCGAFDTILCADCLFFEEGRDDLIELVDKLLRKDGKCMMFAPTRGNTFDIFVEKASLRFNTFVNEVYNSKVHSLHCKMKKLGQEHYDENIHFPLLLQLTKK